MQSCNLHGEIDDLPFGVHELRQCHVTNGIGGFELLFERPVLLALSHGLLSLGWRPIGSMARNPTLDLRNKAWVPRFL